MRARASARAFFCCDPGKFAQLISAVMTLTIRPATPTDIPAITRIYAHAVEHGTASFELTPPDEAEMTKRMNELLAYKFPYLVGRAGWRTGRLCLCRALPRAAGLPLHR